MMIIQMDIKDTTARYMLTFFESMKGQLDHRIDEYRLEFIRAYNFEKRKFDDLPPLDFDAGEIKEWLMEGLNNKTNELLVMDFDEERADRIGSNGATGEHYEPDNTKAP